MVSKMGNTALFGSTNVHHIAVLHEHPIGILVLCGLSQHLEASCPPSFFFINSLSY